MRHSALTVPAAFLRRDWAIARSYRFPFLLQLVGNGFVLILLFQVGRLVDRAPVAAAPELSHGYFPFALVGTVVLGVVQTALHAFADKLREEQATGTLEALLATSAQPATVILCSALYELLQAVLVGSAVFAVAAAGTVQVALSPGALVGSAAAVAGLLTLFAGLGVLLAAFTVVFKRGGALAGLVSGALALLGGVWFPVDLLPAGLRWLASALPFTWGVAALRRSLLFGDVDEGRLLGLVLCGMFGLLVSLKVFTAAVDLARRQGSLGQY